MRSTYGGSYNGTGCASVYCHSNGQINGQAGGVAAYSSINWTTVGPLSCTSCHGNGLTGAALSGKHPQHVDNAAVLGTNFACVDCHAKTVNAGNAITSKANHVNKFMDISGTRIRTMSQTQVTNGTCTSYCHSNGKGTVVTTANWSSGPALGCNGCHGTSNSVGSPDYSNGGSGSALANSHTKHAVTYGIRCEQCHNVTTAVNGSLLGNGNHLNRTIDVSLTDGGYDPSTKTCSTVYCHSNGSLIDPPFKPAVTYASPIWGDAQTNCDSCHSNSIGMSGSHLLHAGQSYYSYSCTRCHMPTTSTGTSITDYTLHVNTTADVGISIDNAGIPELRGSYISSACINVYCHGDGQSLTNPGNANTATWTWTTASNNKGIKGCNPCHADMTSGSHAIHNNTSALPCSTCHNATTTTSNAVIATYHADQKITLQFTDVSNASNSRGKYNNYSAGGGKIYSKPVTETPTPASCTMIYCHSDGTSATAPNYRTQAWNGTTACYSCHGNTSTTNDIRILGRPGYPTGAPKANSHYNGFHESYTCFSCHDNVATSGSHADGIYNLNLVTNGAGPGANIIVKGNFTTPTTCVNFCHFIRSDTVYTWGLPRP